MVVVLENLEKNKLLVTDFTRDKYPAEGFSLKMRITLKRYGYLW